jgi:hypothetical protein
VEGNVRRKHDVEMKDRDKPTSEDTQYTKEGRYANAGEGVKEME